jgi:hypothetical protein
LDIAVVGWPMFIVADQMLPRHPQVASVIEIFRRQVTGGESFQIGVIGKLHWYSPDMCKTTKLRV